MNERLNIADELRLISPFLAGMEKANVFLVPEGYFEGLAEKITLLVSRGAAPEKVQQVPGGYFDSLSDTIMARIKRLESDEDAREELRKNFPLLYALRNKNVFTVPEGYFEVLPGKVVSKIPGKPAKTVVFRRMRSVWKYAAAAVLTGAIVVSSLRIFNTSPDGQKGQSPVTESSGLAGTVSRYETPQQVNAALSTLTDDEIANYLEKHGNILDNEALSSDVDAQSLPSAADYLTDANALDNYLSMINAGSSKQIPGR